MPLIGNSMESAPGEGFVVYSVKRKNFNYTIIYKTADDIQTNTRRDSQSTESTRSLTKIPSARISQPEDTSVGEFATTANYQPTGSFFEAHDTRTSVGDNFQDFEIHETHVPSVTFSNEIAEAFVHENGSIVQPELENEFQSEESDSYSDDCSDSLNESQIPPATALKSWQSSDTLHIDASAFTAKPASEDSSKNNNNLQVNGNGAHVYSFVGSSTGNSDELNHSSTYKRRYKKKSESDRSQYTLDSIRAKLSNPLNNSRSLISSNQNNPWTNNHSSTTLSPNESTLDFATHRSTNYPKSSDLKPGEEIEMQTISGPVLTSNGFDDMDFMMTSEPVVSRKPFMQAQAMNGNRGMDQLDLFSGFDHRLSQNRDIRTVDTHDGVGGGIAGDYREMPIDVPGQDPNAVFGYNASSNSPSHSSPHAVLPNALLTTSNHQQNRRPNEIPERHPRPPPPGRPQSSRLQPGQSQYGPQSSNNPFAPSSSAAVAPSPNMFFDERLTETTSIGGHIESPDEDARRVMVHSSHNQYTPHRPQQGPRSHPPNYSEMATVERHNNHPHLNNSSAVQSNTSHHNDLISYRLNEDMQYTNLDFSQIPNLASSLPQQDKDTETLQSALNSEAFKRSLIHFDAINRVTNSAGSGKQQRDMDSPGRPFDPRRLDDDEDDKESSIFGERLFTPASSNHTRSGLSSAGTGQGRQLQQHNRPVSQNSLPTTQQIQEAIKEGQQQVNSANNSHTGAELYRILDSENMQAVLSAHDQLAASSVKQGHQANGLGHGAVEGHPNNHLRHVGNDDQMGSQPVVTSFTAANSTRQDKSVNSSKAAFSSSHLPTDSSLYSEVPPEVIERGDLRIVIVQKGENPLGATILKDGEQIKIGRVVKGGVIETSGVMNEGDELLKINDIELSRNMSIDDVCDLLASLTGRVHFLLRPSKTTATSAANSNLSTLAKNSNKNSPRVNGHHMVNGAAAAVPNGQLNSVEAMLRSRTNTATSIFDEQVLHVRALFDFDPEDDEYVPCRELGIPFDRGTVLHVMNTEDPNWWQAFPDHVIGLSASDDSGATGSLLAIQNHNSLAGLIPSHTFWKKREALRLMIETTNQHHESFNEKRSSGGLCCSSNRSRANKIQQQQRKGAGGPQLNPSAIHVLSYEEVGLFRPETSTPRPVVLVGPTKIGIFDLRQRLILKQPQNFEYPVPHTTRAAKPSERDGVDYHFVNRNNFKSKISEGEIVDHYESAADKHLYGTSRSAITAVAHRNKAAILCPNHPRTIEALRSGLLMPFVVFIAPPGLEQLKSVSREMGNTLRENELRAVIEEARVLDLQWGHLFDDVIVNCSMDQCLEQLAMLCDKLRTEPQWVPVQWLGREVSPILVME
ncbi:uncharacterized protein LOC142349480 isoform X2 [Convolutriloba macropyga]|uniref:uncharacterized protein LOC142349480 isoform X2 n=1 Tax=Convolutriloba macropyga TaxID=536237 RepID=UPI003F521DD0